MSITVPNVPNSTNVVASTNALSVHGKIYAVVLYCRTNVNVALDTVPGFGASPLSRTIVASRSLTNVVETTNSFFCYGDLIRLHAHSSGDTGAVSSAKAIILYGDP